MPKPEQGTIALVVLEPAGGPATVLGKVTFDVTTDETPHPWVTLRCFQDGIAVYLASRRMDLGTVESRSFTLASNSWQSGPAEAIADLEDQDHPKPRTLASITFHIDG